MSVCCCWSLFLPYILVSILFLQGVIPLGTVFNMFNLIAVCYRIVFYFNISKRSQYHVNLQER